MKDKKRRKIRHAATKFSPKSSTFCLHPQGQFDVLDLMLVVKYGVHLERFELN
jgi:hypothetical protein